MKKLTLLAKFAKVSFFALALLGILFQEKMIAQNYDYNRYTSLLLPMIDLSISIYRQIQ
jgi:hypothetical protein